MDQSPNRSRSVASQARSATAAGPSRRELLRAGAATLALGVVRLRWPAAAGAQESASPTTEVCVLTPELTEGPYYVPLNLIREDITEGKPGVPLRLRLAVVDVASDCAPLADAAVDIWHCDAQGYYSGVSGDPGGGGDPEAGAGAEAGTFLRGIQLTSEDGIAEFDTIYPGWYSGRTVHIHLKVHVGGASDVLDLATPGGADAVFEGGHVAHTGQLFFDDAMSDEIFDTGEAYGGRDNAQRLRNDQDGILGDHAAEPGFILALTPLGEDPLTDGFLGEITVGIDPSSTPEPAEAGGGPPPGDGPPGGTPPAGGEASG
jgi:protocatechuate 3,4-dioxygenase beta subunit